jgi:hypothetical protein
VSKRALPASMIEAIRYFAGPDVQGSGVFRECPFLS